MSALRNHAAGSAVPAATSALTDNGHIAAWASRFGLLGDETRLRVLLALHQAPGITVGDLACTVGISQNATSHSLSGLRATGMISNRRDGRFRRWSVTHPATHELLRNIGADPGVMPAATSATRPPAAVPLQTGTP